MLMPQVYKFRFNVFQRDQFRINMQIDFHIFKSKRNVPFSSRQVKGSLVALTFLHAEHKQVSDGE